MSYIDVVTTLASSRAALDTARAADVALGEEYATPPTYREPGHVARVADLHRRSKVSLKVAEVEALHAIAEAIAALAPQTPQGLTYGVGVVR